MSQPREEPQAVTAEYSGKWIAWNEAQTRIVASGETLDEAEEAAQKAGIEQPVMEKVPPLEGGFVGGL